MQNLFGLLARTRGLGRKQLRKYGVFDKNICDYYEDRAQEQEHERLAWLVGVFCALIHEQDSNNSDRVRKHGKQTVAQKLLLKARKEEKNSSTPGETRHWLLQNIIDSAAKKEYGESGNDAGNYKDRGFGG